MKERGAVENAGVVSSNGGEHHTRTDRRAGCVIDCAEYLRDNRAVGVVCYGVRHHRAVGTEGIAWRVARGVGFHVAEMRIAKSDGRTGIRYR